ncbi:MAG: CNNM domain-containing protein, partial [Synergistaceae bacterium]|nr:CNNM domain-containing protein [Synergistaceae bacterium]
MTDILVGALMLLFLLCLSAFFSASETAVTTSGRSRLLALLDKKPFYRPFIKWLLDDVQSVLTFCLISNNIVNIAASSIATAIVMRFFGTGAVVWVVPI